MPWDSSSVPGVTSADTAATLTEWRHRQEERRGAQYQPHHHQHPQPKPESPETPETPATPPTPEGAAPVDGDDAPPVHHLNILA